MADEQRPLATIQTDLADNTTKSVSPQKLRNAMVSCYQRGFGMMSVADGATAQTSIGTSPVKLTGFTTDGTASLCDPDHTSDDIMITEAGYWGVFASLSFTGTPSITFTFEVYLDETSTGIKAAVTLDGSGSMVNVSLVGDLAVGTNEAVDIRVAASSGSANSITLVHCQLRVRRSDSGVA